MASPFRCCSVDGSGNERDPFGAFQMRAVPASRGRRRFVGGIEEVEQHLFWILRLADGLVRQDEFAQVFMKERLVGTDWALAVAVRLGIGVGVECGLLEAGSTRPETGAADFVRVR